MDYAGTNQRTLIHSRTGRVFDLAQEGPELPAQILSRHTIFLSHSLMVENRRYDISGAYAVGTRGLGVRWGYAIRAEHENAGADQLVESTADLARTVISMVSGKVD